MDAAARGCDCWKGVINIGVKMLSARFVNSVLLGRRNNSNSCFLRNNCPLRRCQNRLPGARLGWPNGERVAESKCAALSRKFSLKATASSRQPEIATLTLFCQFYEVIA